MNLEETLKIFSVLKANYPNFYKNISRMDAEAQVNLWCEMFQDTPYEIVGTAVKAYIATDTDGYPPNVGKIKEQIRKLTQTEELTEQEAVNLILKACSNGIYHSQEEFNKLPPVLQKLVGSPNQLKEWAVMDRDVVQSVVSSNLMRSYRAIAERERQQQALPSSIKGLLAQATEKLKLEG
jgi:hypothetical protein